VGNDTVPNNRLLADAPALGQSASGSNAEQIVNGGFELPALPSGTDFVNMTGSAIVGWTIPNGWSVDLIRDYWPAFQGNQSIDLDGDSGIGTTVFQTFETDPGRKYSLSFEYANNIDTDTAVGRVEVLGAAALLDTTIAHSGSTPDGMHHVAFTASFTSDSPLTTLQFTHLGSQPCAEGEFPDHRHGPGHPLARRGRGHKRGGHASRHACTSPDVAQTARRTRSACAALRAERPHAAAGSQSSPRLMLNVSPTRKKHP
jgi:hypothetical protein